MSSTARKIWGKLRGATAFAKIADHDDDAQAGRSAVLEFLQTYIHTTNSDRVRFEFARFVKSHSGSPERLLNNGTIDSIKYLARVHGLPRSFSSVLLPQIRRADVDELDTNHWYPLKLFLTLKYATLHDPDFVRLSDLLDLIDKYRIDDSSSTDKGFFYREIVTQLFLTIVSVLNPDRIALETVPETRLKNLEKYLSVVNAKFKTTIQRSLEKMGYWSGGRKYVNSGSHPVMADSYIRDGEQIIRSSHRKKASKVTAHVVRTQETQMMTTEENVSEKTQMQNISLSNALNQSRTRTKVAAHNQEVQLSPAKSASGSERWWYRTTALEVQNFLARAQNKQAISPDDVQYLVNKFGGFKFCVLFDSKSIVNWIANIFDLISVYQELTDDTIISLLEVALDSRWSNHAYDQARLQLLRATERHCARRKSVRQKIYDIIVHFQQRDESCTKEMDSIIWRITSRDDNFSEENMAKAVSLLKNIEDCEQALSYISEQISKETRCKQLERLNFIPALIQVVLDRPDAEGSGSSSKSNQSHIQKSLQSHDAEAFHDIWWNLIPGRKIYTSLRDEGTINVGKAYASILSPFSVLHGYLDYKIERRAIEREAQQEENTTKANSNHFTEVCRLKAAEMIEDYLTMSWTDGLNSEQLGGLIQAAMFEGAGKELISRVVRCVLRCFVKNQEKASFWKQFPNIRSVFGFLFAVASTSPDKTLQIFTLAIISNLLNNPDVKEIVINSLLHIDFLRDKLQRHDVIFISSGQVVLEENLDQEMWARIRDINTCDEKDFVCVSQCAARILLFSAENENIVLDESSTSLAAQSLLSSFDKMTKIYCAEYLFQIASSLERRFPERKARSQIFTLSVLNDIGACTFHSVRDVRLNATAAYCTALAWVTRHFEVLEDHVNSLADLYSFKKAVLLDGVDYSKWINPMILNVFCSACRRGMELGENVFQLLTLVLNTTCVDSKESEDFGTIDIILSTMESFCSGCDHAKDLPETVVDAVVNLLLESDIFDENCARIVELCMKAGRWVSDAVLAEFSKYLSHPLEVSLPFLRRLCLGNNNQELPDTVFESFQMELVGLRLHPEVHQQGNVILEEQHLVGGGDPAELFDCLKNCVSNGKSLSPLVLAVLNEHLRNDEANIKDVIQCLTGASANGQSLPKEHIHLSLSKDSDFCVQLEFAEAVVRRNQELPSEFERVTFSHLEKEDNDAVREAKILKLVTTMILYNYKLPADVVEAYCKQILATLSNPQRATTTDNLSALVRLLEMKMVTNGVGLCCCKEAFLKAFESGNVTLMDLGIRGVKNLPAGALSEEEKERFAAELETYDLNTYSQAENCKPSHVARPTKVQLLRHLQLCMDKDAPFPQAWEEALRDHLTNELDFAESVCQMLKSTSELRDTDVMLLEGICVSMVGTSSSKIKTTAMRAFEEAVNSRGFKPTSFCVAYLLELREKGDVGWLDKILKSPALPDVISAIETWLKNPADPRISYLVRRYLEHPFISKQHFQDVICSTERIPEELWIKIPGIASIIAEAVLAEGDCVNKLVPKHVKVIEDEILQMGVELNKKVLHAYERTLISARQLATKRQECAEALMQHLVENEDKMESADVMLIFTILLYLAGVEDLPTSSAGFIVVGLQSLNTLIRGKSFALALILRKKNAVSWQQIKDELWPIVFFGNLETVYSEILQGPVSKSSLVESDFSLTLIFNLFTLSKWDLKGLRKKKEGDWIRHLVLSDLVACFANDTLEQLQIYPLAKKLFTTFSPLARLEITECLKEFLSKHERVSPIKAFKFILEAAEEAKEKGNELFSISEPEWISRVLHEAIKKKTATKFPHVSSPIISATVTLALELLGLNLLDDLIDFLEEGSNFGSFQNLLGLTTKLGPNVIRILRFFLESQKPGFKFSPTDMERDLQLKFLMSSVPKEFHLHSQLNLGYKNLLSRGFDFDCLHRLNSHVMGTRSILEPDFWRLEILVNVLFQLHQYEVHPARFHSIVRRLLECEKLSEWVDWCNTEVMDHVFSGSTGVKTTDVVKNEYQRDNRLEKCENEELESFSQMVSTIQNGNLRSVIVSLSTPVGAWTAANIKYWAVEYRKISSARQVREDELKLEVLTVLNHACNLKKNYRLTAVQILSILRSCNSSKRGVLLQVATGSGKSTIIAVIAVYQALRGTRVDVYTSSPVLAERDAREWSDFYQLFGLTADHNGDKGSGYVRGEKVCYKKDIVYGDTSQFQFDTLRDEYSGLFTRAGRDYGYAIVDEVDSMLIDDSSKLARLSSTLPGMDLLKILYHFVWNRLYDVQQKLFAVGSSTYYLEGRQQHSKNGPILYQFSNETGELRYIEDVVQYILQNSGSEKQLERARIFEVEDIETFVRDHLEQYLLALLGEKTFPGPGPAAQKVELPQSLVKFALSQVKNWVDSALTAVTFEENVHYVVDDGKVKPVDFHTTGIIQPFSNWNNGLHQFLQLKHSLKVTTETVTTNFLSNMAMFQKYGYHLVGFTGTLGSSFSQDVLRRVYSVDTKIIPEMYYKRFSRLPDTILPNLADWFDTIVSSALHESTKRRAVLIICQTIKEAEQFAAELLRKSNNKAVVKLYCRNDQAQEKEVEQVHQGDIIVATNLAGRGTDIKTDKVEDYGGLHVIVTFLPESLRVEEQAFGRTARQGKKGTGQLIVVQPSEDLSQDLVSLRGMMEQEKLNSFKNQELPKIQLKDSLFQRFCLCYHGMRKELMNPQSVLLALISKAKATIGWDTLGPVDKVTLQAVEEQWAVFLKQFDDGKLEENKVISLYGKFEQELKSKFKDGKSIESTGNCYYWIQQGNEYYKQDWTLGENLSNAVECFDSAINLEPEFAAGAWAGKAYALLKGKTHLFGSNSHTKNYKLEAVKHLQQALKILHNEIAMYSTAQIFLQQRTQDTQSEIFKQLTTKTNLVGEYCRNLENVLSEIQKSRRRVFITSHNTEGGRATVELPDGSTNIPRVIDGGDTFSVDFHDLTAGYDCRTVDQAIKTIGEVKSWFSTTATEKAKDKLRKGVEKSKAFFGSSRDKKIERGIAIIVRNQNLKAVATAVAKIRETVSSIAFEAIDNWKIVETVLQTLSPQKYRLGITGNRRVLAKIRDAVQVSEALIGHTVESASEGSAVSYETKLNAHDNFGKFVPNDIDILEFILDCQDTNKLKPAESMMAKNTFSMTLREVAKTTIEDHWEAIFQQFNSTVGIFGGLDCDEALKIVMILREMKISFVLRFENLTREDAVFLLGKAHRSTEDMKQRDLKEMGQQYTSDFMPLEEIRELLHRGVHLIVSFGEKGFVPWWSVVSLSIVASAQIVAGSLLIPTGLGASVGMGLIREGMSDYVAAHRAYSTRNFAWSDYVIQKAVSVTISVASMGLSSLKDGAKGAKMVFEGTAREKMDQAGKLAVVKGHSLNQAIQMSSQNLKSLVFKQIVVQGAETLARTGLNSIVDAITKFCFEKVRQDTAKLVSKEVRAKLGAGRSREVISYYYAVDSTRSQQYLPAKVDNWLAEMTNPQSGFWNQAWQKVGWPLCRGILSDPKYLGSTISMAIRLAGVCHGSYEIINAVGTVCSTLEKKLETENKSLKAADIIQARFSITTVEAEQIVGKMEFSDVDNFKVKKFPTESDMKAYRIPLPDLEKLFCDLQHAKSNFTFKCEAMSRIVKSIVDTITSHIIRTADSQLVSPLTSFAVGKMVATISQEIQSRYIVSDNELSQDQQRLGGPKTVAAAIAGNAKVHNIAYQKRDIISRSISISNEEPKQNDGREDLRKEAKAAISKLENGGPADMSIVFLLAKMYGANIKVVDDPNYEPTAEDKEAGVKIVIFEEAKDGDLLGHYTLKVPGTGGKADEIKDFSGDGGVNFDCGFQVLGEITGKSVKELRLQAVDLIACNEDEYVKITEPARWICDRYPEEAHNLLQVGGFRRPQANKQRVQHNPRFINEEVETEEIPTKLNGRELKILDGDKHVKRLRQMCLLGEGFDKGSGVEETTQRKYQARQVNRWAEPGGFLLDGEECDIKRVLAGHLGNAKMGQLGNDTNLMLKSPSCNKVFSDVVEDRLKEFNDIYVNNVPDGGKAHLIIEYEVPEYKPLQSVAKTKDGQGPPKVEVPFAPRFTVKITPVGLNESLKQEFDRIFAPLKSSCPSWGVQYGATFVNKGKAEWHTLDK